MSVNIHLNAVDPIATADSIANAYFIDTIGNKTDASTNGAAASIIALLRYVIANLSSDTDVAALIGALDSAAATGAVTATDVLMAYVKQLVTELQVVDGIADDILVDTNELQTDLTDGGRLDLLIDAIKAVTDIIPDAGALTSIAQDSTVAKEATLGTPTDTDIATDLVNIQTEVDKIGVIVNTGGTATIGAILGDFLNTDLATVLGSPVGADLSADIAAVKLAVDTIDDFVDTEIAAIKLETDQIGTIVNSAGTATLGAVLGDFVNVTLVSRLDTIDNFLDTEIAAIKAVTDLLPDAGVLSSLAQGADLATTDGKVDTISTAVVTTIPDLLAVPTEDLATDATINQVVGKKSDTVAGTSLVSLVKQNAAALVVIDDFIDSEVNTIVDKLTAGVTQIATVTSVDGSATTWTQAAHRLFTVTGTAMVRVFGVIAETLVGAATIEVGVAGATAGLIAQVADATTLATGDILAIVSGIDIDIVVGTADVTDGQIVFYCEWKPISVGATVVAAVWD